MAEYDSYMIARFWSKVAVGRSNQCWPWLAAPDRYGYGQFKAVSGEAPVRAHRVAYEIVTGEELDPEVQILHSCDTPACCNPRHLTKGDHVANMADRHRKGRYLAGLPRGSKLPLAESRNP